MGDGVFETTKLVDGRPFALTRHLDRLDRSVAGLGLPPVDREVVLEGIAAVLGAREPLAFGRLRFTVTGGAGPLGSDRDDHGLTYIVTSVEQEQPTGSGRVAVVPWTRNERAATAGLKTTSYADNVIALARAKQSGAVEAVLANTRGDLCEGTGSNVFVVIDSAEGVVRTPPLTDGPLAGVTRALVLQWGREAGLDVREESMPLEVLQEADEVFLTSSIKDVYPVDAVDGRPLAPGPGHRPAGRGLRRPLRPGGRPVTDRTDDNITLDAQDDDWAWRRRLRANPVTARLYRIAVAVVGAVVVAAGLVAVPAPGPGWLIVFAGVGIWATEFEWAQRLLRWGRGLLTQWSHWMGRQPVWVRGLVGLATLVAVLLLFWGLFAITGVPSLLPDALEDVLRPVPGLG